MPPTSPVAGCSFGALGGAWLKEFCQASDLGSVAAGFLWYAYACERVVKLDSVAGNIRDPKWIDQRFFQTNLSLE